MLEADMKSMRIGLEMKTKFQRYYSHALRDKADKLLEAKKRKDFGECLYIRQECSKIALDKVRYDVVLRIASDTSEPPLNDFDREDLFAEVMLTIFDYQINLVTFPADIQQIIEESEAKKKAAAEALKAIEAKSKQE